MSNNYIHYIKREIILATPEDPSSPFYAELQAYDSGFDVPAFHVTRSRSWPVTEIQEDDVIWLVGQLSTPWGKLPPAIDGKVVVGNIEEITCEGEIMKKRFTAKEGSTWFPLADATNALSRLEVVLKKGTIKHPYEAEKDNLGQAFQSMKMIHNPSILNSFAEELLNRAYEFISYRVADGTRGAFDRAAQQINHGACVFWDRWSLPRRLAERREIVSDGALDKLLMEKIKAASSVWGVESPRYSEEGSYSQKEREMAVKLKKYTSGSTV